MLNFLTMTKLQRSIAIVIFLSNACFGQVASISKLSTAGGFLEVCGRPDESPKEQLDSVKSTPPSQSLDKIKAAMTDRMTEVAMCLAFVSGLEQGWKEGHEHGVVATQFPEGWPKDEKKALAALPFKQLQAGQAAMTIDVPCIPDYVTIGQERDIIVKYMRESEKKGNFFLSLDLTSHMMWLAFQDAFPCPVQPAKPSDTIK